MKIAFIGFGEAARAFTDSLTQTGLAQIARAYDQSPCTDIAAAARQRNVVLESSPAEAVADANWIISAVTADQSYAAALAIYPSLKPGQILIDINSVSPQRKRDTATLINAAGAHFVDMAVMAPVLPKGHRTPVLIAGDGALIVSQELQRLEFTFEYLDALPGSATAIKMVRSLFVKGLEALTVETLLAASASTCFDYVLNSLSQSYPGLGWPQNVEYLFERTLRHGTRRAAEMQESAATINALGLKGELAQQIADVQASMGRLPANHLSAQPLQTSIAEILKLRLGC